MYNFKVEQVTKELILWIRDWFNENGKDSPAVIGISGGKDSTIVAKLCVEALGRDKVIGVMMPNGEQKDISDSIKVCELLGIKNYTINIANSVHGVLAQMKENGIEISDQTLTNLPARIRMSTLYAVAQSCNGRVSNNCNLSENVCGFSTLFGDSVGSFSPLGKLTTVEIVQIGDYLGLPHELVHKTPIDGLNINPDGSYVTDEQSMGVTYEQIHLYVRDKKHLSSEVVEFISDKERKNKFKLDIIRLPEFEPKEEHLYDQLVWVGDNVRKFI